MPTALSRLALLAAWALLPSLVCAEDGVVQVRIGAVVERTLDEVKSANLAYGPKQDIDPASGETHVYLPYGSGRKLYWRVEGELTDPKPGACAEFVSQASDKVASLTYKLAFDKPIKAFRCWAGYAEQVMAASCAAGVEYSTDGSTWKTVKEHPRGTRAVTAPFIDQSTVVGGLDARVLYLRIYARDAANPVATAGPEMYLKMRISGDVGWGDAATTFFTSQNQIWVTPK